MGFFYSNGNYKLEAWKNFKRKYDITKATRMLFLTAPKEEFFSSVKRLLNKNKKYYELSPYVAKFFKVFLKSKGTYKKIEARVYLRCYDTEKDKIRAWGDHVWDNSMANSIKLALIDFQKIPGVINKEMAPKDVLYFLDFLDMAKKLTDPSRPIWRYGYGLPVIRRWTMNSACTSWVEISGPPTSLTTQYTSLLSLRSAWRISTQVPPGPRHWST